MKARASFWRWLGIAVLLAMSMAFLQPWQGQKVTALAEEKAPQAQPVVRTAVAFAQTSPLRDWPVSVASPGAEKPREQPFNRPLPRALNPQNKALEAQGPGDPLAQWASQAPGAGQASVIQGFPGPSNADNAAVIGGGVAPPDINGDVGPNHVVVMTNLVTAIYDRSGNLLTGPVANNSFWSGMTGSICAANNDGDPIVLYDQDADRWLVSQFALDFTTPEFHQCIAISQTPDPTGAWYTYDFLISTSKMNDYPHFGVWPDAYYMSINQFDASTFGWAGQGAVAFERAAMLAGDPGAQMIYFDLASIPDLGGMLPSHWEGATAPPTGEPNYFVQMDDDAWGYPQDQLEIWAFHVDWTTPANSTFTHVTDIAVSPFDSNMCNYSRTCIPQMGSTQKLDALSDRLMYRLQYRNFGTYQTLVVNHTVDVDGNDTAGIRWYELRNSGGSWGLHQEGTFSVSGAHVWMGSIAMNGFGDMALGYTLSGTNNYPSVYFTGRLGTDPLGSMTFGNNVIVDGGGSQEGVSRWGDYTAMSVDPVDDCTFWYFGEYVETGGSWEWNTYVGTITTPNCTAAGGILQGTVTDASTSAPIAGAVVTLSPGGGTTTTDASGFYQFTGLPAGTYDMTVTHPLYYSGSATGVTVTDGSTTVQDFALNPKPPVTVTGTVTDMITGWPLHARIDISGPGYTGGPVYTDPVTGMYSVTLYQDNTYTFVVTSLVPGYQAASANVTPTADPWTQDFALSPDLAACNAPGYTFQGFYEGFDAGWPSGWTVVDNAGTGVVWDLASNWGDGNYTGGAGDAADANSDASGAVDYDTELWTPVIDPATLPTLTLTYLANYQNFAGYDYLDLDISTDGGATWTTILSWNEDHGGLGTAPGEAVVVDLAPYVTGPFILRWHYYDPTTSPDWDWYAQIDEVRIGDCVPPAAGRELVFGTVAYVDGTPMPNAFVRTFNSADETTSFIMPEGPLAGQAVYFVAADGVAESILAHTYNSFAFGAVTPTAGQATRVDLVARQMVHLKGDFNGDGKANIAIFRPSTGTWYIQGIGPVAYGKPGDIPVPADYNGDGKTDIAVFRPSTSEWFVRGMGAMGVYGAVGDIPVPADYDGDGKAEIAVFRPSTGTWHIKGIGMFAYGKTGDIPVPADYNGDGKAEIAVFRPGNPATWFVKGMGSVNYGHGNELPVPADYNGDGKAEMAVFGIDPGTGMAAWYIRFVGVFSYGRDGDFPAAADYNGDGKADIAVFRPSTGQWFIRGVGSYTFGTGDDIPVNPIFDQDAKP